MTPANLRELLTAAVDGELSPPERKTAERLLRESVAARVLFDQLKADAARLKKLPRVTAPADLTDNVMSVITDRAMSPTPLPPTRMPARKFNWGSLPIWANVVTAAGVLVTISLGSYLYFAASQKWAGNQNPGVAKLPPVPESGLTNAADPPAPRDNSTDRDPSVVNVAVAPRPGPEIGPAPREVLDPRVETAPIRDVMPEIEPFLPDKIRLSQLFRMDELPGDADAGKKLLSAIKKDELIRLDLFCQATPRALEQVVAALKARGVSAVTDHFANDRLRKNVPTELMIFTEVLTPDEVAQLIADLAAADKKAGAGEFDTLVAAPFLGEDLVKLAKLLGVPNITAKLPKAKEGVDIRRPLPEGTAQHVANTLSGVGSGSAKGGKSAVVVAYSPVNGNPTASREIKQFLDRRGERKPDAKPLMLVLKIISK
jgi:hypothetical protein